MDDEAKKEIYRGHFDECMVHLSRSIDSHYPKFTKETATPRIPIADFCAITEKSVARWINGENEGPVGLVRIKMMCFLEMVGYKIIGISRMKQGPRGLLELIGYSLMPIEEALKVVGYKKAQAIYKILSGTEKATDDKEQAMWSLWLNRREELEKKKAELFALYGAPISALLTSEPSDQLVIKGEKFSFEPKKYKGTHDNVIGLARVLLDLLNGENFAEIPAGSLRGFLEASDIVLALSGKLSSLSARLIAEGKRAK